MISIHAPTRGATHKAKNGGSQQDFNPRSHERSDRDTVILSLLSQNFNPRSHERSDVWRGGSCRGGRDFNPRSHERSDFLLNKDSKDNIISIHAPTRGATEILLARSLKSMISIHAPTRGATQ